MRDEYVLITLELPAMLLGKDLTTGEYCIVNNWRQLFTFNDAQAGIVLRQAREQFPKYQWIFQPFKGEVEEAFKEARDLSVSKYCVKTVEFRPSFLTDREIRPLQTSQDFSKAVLLTKYDADSISKELNDVKALGTTWEVMLKDWKEEYLR